MTNYNFIAGKLYKLQLEQKWNLYNWLIYNNSYHLYCVLGKADIIAKKIENNSIIMCLTNLIIDEYTAKTSYMKTIRFLYQNKIIWINIDNEQVEWFQKDWKLTI